MKRNIALLISIITLILLVLFLRVQIIIDPDVLTGTMVTNGIYGYDLETENLSVNGLTTKNHDIYYLLMDVVNETEGIYNYKLKKLNINTNQITEINSLENKKSYCSIKEQNIYCTTSNDFQVYDLNFHEIFGYSSNEESLSASFAPYKDTYIKIDNLEIYILQNKETLYRTISTDKNIFYETYFKTSDNTYLLFLDEEGYYYIYDIDNEELIATEKKNYLKYDYGLFFYDESYYTIYDLVNREIKEYENILQEDYYYTGAIDENKNIFYLYDVISEIIYIIDLNNGTLQELDTNNLTDGNPISSLFLQENYLYAYILQDKNNFYVIDLEELELETTDIEKYTDELTTNISKRIENIKEDYSVNIHIKEDAIIDFPDFYAEELLNNEIILNSLTKLENILSKYDLTFFESFYNNGFDGLNLYLTGTLRPSDYETQASNPAAYSLTYNGEYMIVIDLNQPNIEELLCHELLHNLEFNLINQNINPFNKWNSYNPSGFSYNNSYTGATNYNYTLSESNPNNVYFIDYYSHTYATEDRARVFERICSCDENSIINDYPNLYQKGLYLQEEITKYFPSLAQTSLFNSLN